MKYKLIILPLLFIINVSHSGWVDDWFDSTISSGGDSHYSNQQRGFYSLGHYGARMNMTQGYPISAALPRIKSGCGGVDIFLGGASFMDADYLVKKFENMIQAAPAIMFDMALTTMSAAAASSMKHITKIVDGLNNLQLDDCAMSKRFVMESFEGKKGDILGGMWAEIDSNQSLTNAVSDSYYAIQSKQNAAQGAPITDLKDSIKGCKINIKNLFEDGSLLEKALDNVGLKSQAHLIRGLIGDVLIDNSAKVPKTTPITPCTINNQDIGDVIYGRVEEKDINGTCSTNSSQSLLDLVDDRLTAISKKLTDKSADLTVDETKFINTTGMPIYALMVNAKRQGKTTEAISNLKTVVSLAYAMSVFDDLQRQTQYMFEQIQTDFKQVSLGNNPDCSLDVYYTARDEFSQLSQRALEQRKRLLQSYNTEMTAVSTYLSILQSQTPQKKLTGK